MGEPWGGNGANQGWGRRRVCYVPIKNVVGEAGDFELSSNSSPNEPMFVEKITTLVDVDLNQSEGHTRVVVDGQIVQDGSYDELAAVPGTFQDLLRTQTLH